MSGPPTRYFDSGDEQECCELLALLMEWRAWAERDEQYAAASCLSDWIEELYRRLVELGAIKPLL